MFGHKHANVISATFENSPLPNNTGNETMYSCGVLSSGYDWLHLAGKTHRARSIEGRRVECLRRRRQLRTMFASVSAVGCRPVAAVFSRVSALPWSFRPAPPPSFWWSRLSEEKFKSGCLSPSSESASPASTSRTSAAAEAISFSARGGELARSSLHLYGTKWVRE